MREDFDPNNPTHQQELQNKLQEKIKSNDPKFMKEATKLLPTMYKSKTEDQLKDELLEKVSHPQLKSFLKNNPKIMTFVARMMKSENALPQLSEIVGNKKKLGAYAIFFS